MGLGMATTYPLVGCLHKGPALLAPSEPAHADADRDQSSNDEAIATSEPAGRTDVFSPASKRMALASLPDGLEPEVPARSWKFIIVHHTATDSGSVATIDEDHRQRTDQQGKPWLGIGYHFLVGNGQGMADGLVEPTFRWREQLQGSHAGSRPYNDHGIGICLVGNFEVEPPTPRQLAAVKSLILSLADRYGIDARHILRHGEITETDCPGSLFPFAEVVRSIESSASRPLATFQLSSRR
jgi:hypothetical protein